LIVLRTASLADLQEKLGGLAKLCLLILDEFGCVCSSKAGTELLFEVVSRAYERQRTLLTTNLPFENWAEALSNERLTGPLFDRITHRVHIVGAN